MATYLPITFENQPGYDLVLNTDFSILPELMSDLQTAHKKLCIVTEDNVSKYYLQTVSDLLAPCFERVHSFVFKAGEANKTLDTVKGIYTTLIENKFDRNDILLALGGGVTGDITGYAAATYLRGIDYIQVPTTLLSQVDSSIGGKTGVDFDGYKNMVGAFYQPKLVYINIATLNTLSTAQFNSGMGEIIKHGLIKDKTYYEWIQEHIAKIQERDPDVLLSMIHRSCIIKGNVVMNDPKEQGERALLNFGHTLGHAIEKLAGFELLHGQCVALGCVLASYISMERGYITEIQYQDIKKTFTLFQMPELPTDFSSKDIIETTKSDKKMDSGIIKFILLKEIGEAYIDRAVTNDEMERALTMIG